MRPLRSRDSVTLATAYPCPFLPWLCGSAAAQDSVITGDVCAHLYGRPFPWSLMRRPGIFGFTGAQTLLERCGSGRKWR